MIALVLVGLFLGTRARKPAIRLMAIWSLAFLIANTLVGKSEARYAIPVFPALAVLLAETFEALLRRAGGPARRRQVILVAVFLAVAVFETGYRSWEELRTWTHPVHFLDTGRHLEQAIHDLKADPQTPIIWHGPFQPIFGPATLFPEDPFHRLFHFGRKALSYHLERPVLVHRRGVPFDYRDFEKDAVLVRVSKGVTNYNRPPEIPEVVLSRLKKSVFETPGALDRHADFEVRRRGDRFYAHLRSRSSSYAMVVSTPDGTILHPVRQLAAKRAVAIPSQVSRIEIIKVERFPIALSVSSR
jgi:hypothetical protein